MTTFTAAQLTALVKTTNFNGTVEEFAAQHGFIIEAEKAKRTAEKRTAGAKGKHQIVVVYSSENGTALTTTNTLFAGRSAEWTVKEWQKITKTSRRNDPRFAALANADDVEVYCGDFFGADETSAMNEALAATIAHFRTNGYDMLTKYKRDIQEMVERQLATSQNDEEVEEVDEECEEEHNYESKVMPSHYSALLAPTCYELNPKTGRMVKTRKNSKK